jgi:hypothetical protein
MAILRHYIGSDERATFLPVDIDHSDAPELVTFHFWYGIKHSSEILSSSFVCDNDCGFGWFMDLAHSLQQADGIYEVLSVLIVAVPRVGSLLCGTPERDLRKRSIAFAGSTVGNTR